MTCIIAIDPGSTMSAWTRFMDGLPTNWGKQLNSDVIDLVSSNDYDHLVFEWFEPRGMPVAVEVIETFFQMGRIIRAFEIHSRTSTCTWSRIPRQKVKLHICGRASANDSNIRAALIDRFGGKVTALGNKANPGPLYGTSSDNWQSLALGLTWIEQSNDRR